MEKKSSLMVVQSNSITQAVYKMTVMEKRLFGLALTKIPFDEEMDHKTPIMVTASEYKDIFNKNQTGKYGGIYENLRKAADGLYRKEVRVELGNGNYEKTRLIMKAIYMESEANITFFFAPDVISHVNQLKGKFTKYYLDEVAELSSIHAHRIYEMLIQWRGKKIQPGEIRTVYTTLPKLKKLLGVEGSYSSWSKFKEKVLNIAERQINESTDIFFSYKISKKGRSFFHLEFMWQVKDKELDTQEVSDALSEFKNYTYSEETRDLPLLS